MSEPPTKRRRMVANTYLDLEAAVDRDNELEEDEDEKDSAFIDDESEEEKDGHQFADNMYRIRQQLVDLLSKEGHLDGGPTEEEEEHAGLLREWLGLDLGDADNIENPRDDEIDVGEDKDDGVATVPRPLWAEIAYNNAVVSGALQTWQDDDAERQISEDDNLYEVSCHPGMEETIAFRIFSWAMQIDSSGPSKNHILERPAASNSPLPRNDIEPSGRAQKRVVLVRSAVANPFLRGRVYIESAKIGYVQQLAHRVRGLNPASVRPVPRELLLRPLLMVRRSFPDRTFVRLLDPPCPTMTCLIVKDYLLMVPRGISSAQESLSSAGRFNADTDAMPDAPPDSRTGEPILECRAATHRGSDIRIDPYGFRYFPLKKLSPSSLEPYEPSTSEVELLFKFGRLNNRHYKMHMSRIMAYSFSVGDRVIFQAGTYDQLIGTVLDPGADGSCSIYVPSQGSVIQVGRRQLRRQFRVGDRVSATTDDVIKQLGSRVGWVVSASEGYKAAWSSIEDRDPVTGQLRTQVGYRVDLCVFSPESGKEVVAAHYEFQFEDNSTVSLQTTTPPSPVSEMVVGTSYTLSISLHGSKRKSFFGMVTAIQGVHVRRNGTETSTELSATIVFSIWDKRINAPFGYPANWIEPMMDFTEYSINLGDVVTLKDREGRWGTARITGIDRQELSLANFTGVLKVSDLGSVRRAGPHDEHIGKTVHVIKGSYKGGVGVVKTVNTVGTCTVELNIQPIRKITVHVTCLRAVDENALYLSLLPLLAPPPRAQTPLAPPSSSDTLPAFQPSVSDIPVDPPQSPDLDCSWLAQAFVHQMPIKLEPVGRKVRRPYHFSNAFYDNEKTGEAPRLMVRVFDRKKERAFAADELSWLPPTDINQTVVRITGHNNGVLYWTVFVDYDYCQVRQVPSKRGAPLFTFPRFELAQVNATRT